MIRLLVPLIVAVTATAVAIVPVGRLRPDHGAWLAGASIAAVFVAALATAWAVTLGFLAHEPLMGGLFAWCRTPLGIHHRLSRWVGVSFLAFALWATVRAVHVVRSWRHHRGAAAYAVHLIESDDPVAFAQTGRHGGVVVSTSMLALLKPAEQQAMLAHEQSHLQHRHDRFLVVGGLVAGIPGLSLTVGRLRHALERWADEDAADIVGDRRVVARALTRAALAAHGQPAGPLSMLGADVPARVEALLRPPLEVRPAALWSGLAAFAVIGAIAAATVQLHHLAELFAVICSR
ncbi:MAG: M56 family metallopeptidase [Actinobacteria bacterium]|nr:M56 family metallopeptidase [Actinomycetota bacterium]MBI3256742.1 M56 family metallopeptidase [Actinomycetota bacterium]